MHGRGCCGPLLLLFVGLICVACCGGGLLFFGLFSFRAESPKEYGSFAQEVLGLSPAQAASYDFTPEDLKALREDGLDPQEVGDAILAAQWADEVLGKGTESVGDPTILVALGQYESGGGCKNCGNADAAAEYAAHPALDAEAQKKALKAILAEAKAADIRSTNPNAAKYVYEDYSGALGSKGGGALGCAQFLASTAVAHLKTVGSPDLWDSAVAKKYMAAELYRLGWRPNLSDAVKLSVLLKWNSDPNGLRKVVETAKIYLKYRSLRGKLKALPGDWKVALLDFLGLLPEREAYAAESLPSSWPEGAITLHLDTEVPQGGERANIELWAKRHQRIVLKPGEVKDFCTITSEKGWGGYQVTKTSSGKPINVGGICANASMLRELVDTDPRLITTVWHKHDTTRFPRYHTVVDCPGTTYAMKNVTDKTLIIVWGQSAEGELAVWVEEEGETKK